MSSRIDRLLGALARLLVRGPEAPYVLGDLEEGLRRDVERGHSPGRARLRFVLNAVGSGLSLARLPRRGRPGRGAGPLWLDVKLSLRMLLRYPGLSAVSVTGMAVAIAVGAGYFTVLGALLDTELPVPAGDRVVMLDQVNVAEGGDRQPSVRDLVTWREQLGSVEGLGAFRGSTRNLIKGDGSTEVVDVAAITADGFHLPGVSPILGRPLLRDDERADAPDVIVIGHDEWRRVFAGAADVIGQEVRLGDAVHTVVGVMPAGFRFPVREQYWIPLRIGVGEYEAGAAWLHVFGRLADGVSLEQARVELEAIGRGMAVESPLTHADLRPRVLPYTHAFMGLDGPEAQLGIRGLQLLISMLLVIVAINVAVLVYARTATRLGELSVRSALGASRRRIVGQLFIEAAVLAGAAAVIGLTLARGALAMIGDRMSRSTEARLPFWIDFGMSWSQVGYVVALTLLASVVVGVIPALKVTGRRLDTLKEFAARGSGLRLGKTWTALIVAQVAIAVAVLPPALNYAGQSLKVGIRAPAPVAHELLRAALVLPQDATAADRLIDRFAAEPGVAGVTWAAAFPGSEHWGRHVQGDGVDMDVNANAVAIDFFDVLEVPVIAGRGFTPADAHEDARTVIVDQTFAQELGGGNVVGRRVRFVPGPGESVPEDWYEIVGVVPAFAHDFKPQVFGAPDPRLFHAAAAVPAGVSALIVKVRGSPAAIARRFTHIAAGVDPDIRLEQMETVAQRWSSEQNAARLVAVLVISVMASVLLLSAAGIYAMMSFTVTRRRREIGIRAALGANGARVLAGIFARAGVQLGAGVVAGLAVALAVEIASPGLVLDGRGAVLLPAVIAVILAVGLLAALGPARRGLSVQPTEMLRDGG